MLSRLIASFVLVRIIFVDRTESTQIVPREAARTFVKASELLHIKPGINPHNGQKTLRAKTVVVEAVPVQQDQPLTSLYQVNYWPVGQEVQHILALGHEAFVVAKKILEKHGEMTKIWVSPVGGFGRYWWSSPDLQKNDDPSAAPVLSWRNSVELWPNTGEVYYDD
jgi:hypothetical protein